MIHNAVRPPSRIIEDLDIFPMERAEIAGGLDDRFFGGKPGCIMRIGIAMIAGIADFLRTKNPVQEMITPASDGCADSTDFNQINPVTCRDSIMRQF